MCQSSVLELSPFWVIFLLLFITLGLCPDWEDWNPKNAKKNAKEAMDNAEKWLDIPQVKTSAGSCGKGLFVSGVLLVLHQRWG